jgi:hypothetical protein
MNPVANPIVRLTAYAMLLSACAIATPSRAAENQDALDSVQEQSEAAGKLFDTERFFVMPIPIANPTIGTGLGATAMYLFEAGENAPLSSVTLAGLYTDTDTWAAAVGTETHFQDDKYRLSGWAGYFNGNLRFFGIGNEAGDRGEYIRITQKGPFLVSKFLVQVANDIFIGPQLRYIEFEISLQDPLLPPDLPDLPPGISIPGSIENVSAGLGAVLETDTRDNRFFAQNGSFFNFTANFARDWIGSDQEYEQYDAGYNLYRPVGNGFIAWRATGCFREGDVPFWDLCKFGGEEDAIRGYVGGQYRDKVSVTTQIEYRRRIHGKWGFVAFAGAGQVGPEIGDIEFDNLLPSFGVGIRFLASEEQRVNLGVDYARGKDSDAWYFRIGEAF